MERRDERAAAIISRRSRCAAAGRVVSVCGAAVLWGAMLATVSCMRERPMLYGQYRGVPGDEWHPLRSFQLDADSTVEAGTLADVVVAIRHDGNTDAASLPLIVEQSTAGAVVGRDTIEIALADADGHWLGRGSYGLYEICDTVARHVRTGPGYSVTLQPAFSVPVKGVKDVGFYLLPVSDGR